MNLSSSVDYLVLAKNIQKTVERRLNSCQNARLCKLYPPAGFSRIILPRRFRELRALAISCWYFPDWLQTEIILALSVERRPNLGTSKEFQHSLQISLFASSEKIMLSYLVQEINLSEVFGTVLQEDLTNALRNLKIVYEKNGLVRKPIRRKGYKDKGTWRAPDRWTPSSDFSLREQQVEREKKLQSFNLLLTYLRHKLG